MKCLRDTTLLPQTLLLSILNMQLRPLCVESRTYQFIVYVVLPNAQVTASYELIKTFVLYRRKYQEIWVNLLAARQHLALCCSIGLIHLDPGEQSPGVSRERAAPGDWKPTIAINSGLTRLIHLCSHVLDSLYVANTVSIETR